MFFLYGLAGVVGGVLGGMGMGGGTLLIPILTIFFDMEQIVSQGINLISFIPMAVVALIIHFKNKLVKLKKTFFIIASGIVTCIVGCFIAKNISGDLLKRIFGGFLVALSIFQFIEIFVINKDKNK